LEESKLFLFTFIAAFAGVIPPGLVNMTVAKSCVERGKRSGVFVALGSCTIVLIQSFLAILLSKYILSHPYINKMLLRAGLVIFLLLTVYFFVQARKDNKVKPGKKGKAGKSYLKGLTIALFNVFPIPYFVALSTAFAPENGNYDMLAMVVFASAAALGSFATLYGYVIGFAKIEKHTKSFSKYSNYFMALLMLILVIVTLFRIFKPFS
jgi:threonine/homoserine/homoserine lactone efflux protein